jgi:hypothetical protein
MAFPSFDKTTKTIDRALRYNGRHIDRRGYLDGYPALISLFSTLDFSKLQHVQAGAYAAYGWMPRVLNYKACEAARYQRLGRFVVTLRGMGIENALDEFRNINDFPINNSVVGTSKFLHFAAPSIFPIWDSKIASYFKCKSTERNDYYAYCEALHRYLPSAIWPASLPRQLSTPEITPLRRLEFCLFRKASESKGNK